MGSRRYGDDGSRWLVRLAALAAVFLIDAGFAGAAGQGRGPLPAPDTEARGHIAAMAAHHLCSGMFVVGRVHQRSVEEVLARDIARFADFRWQDDFHYVVDTVSRSATVSGPGVDPPRTARYHGDQGCTILPAGVDRVFFEPVELHSSLPDPSTQPWPLGYPRSIANCRY